MTDWSTCAALFQKLGINIAVTEKGIAYSVVHLKLCLGDYFGKQPWPVSLNWCTSSAHHLFRDNDLSTMSSLHLATMLVLARLEEITSARPVISNTHTSVISHC